MGAISSLPENYLSDQRWNATCRPYPREKSLADLVARWSSDTPDACAIRDGDVQLSYTELDRRANAVAHALARHGVQAGQKVAILGQRCAEAVIAMLGILKIGAAYVPLDASYPAARLDTMAEDAGVRTLIELPGNSCQLKGVGHVVRLNKDTMNEPPPVLRPVTGDDLAYVMFTSGSTGRPKAVGVRQRGVARLVVNTNYIEFTSKDRVLHVASLSFDASTFEIWGALLNGACLVIAGWQGLFSADDLRSLIEKQAITTMLVTTAIFHHLAREQADVFGNVHNLVVGGETLDPQLARKVLMTRPPRRLINAYGPTENATITTTHLIRDIPDDASTVPIGSPIANTTCYVLRDDGSLAAPGEEGELFTGGDGVAFGYLNDPALSSDRFVPDRFSAEPTARLYRTGDIASWREDGALEFHGRHDTQLKIHGRRIEASEIESLMREYPGVTDAAVVRHETHTSGDAQLVAHLVARDARNPPDAAMLREHIGTRLPSYMIPACFNLIDRLPLSPAGKVDRKALALMPVQHRPATAAAATTLLEHVRNIWKEVLADRGVESGIELDDTFFDIGGDSFDVSAIHARITDTLNVPELTLLDLFTYPTLRGYSDHVASLLHIAPTTPLPAVKQLDASDNK